MVKLNRLVIFLLACGAVAAASTRASAATHHHYQHHRHVVVHHAAVTPRHAALLEDADTGRILYSESPDLSWPPASMAKMMMLLVAEDQIHAGRFSTTPPSGFWSIQLLLAVRGLGCVRATSIRSAS